MLTTWAFDNMRAWTNASNLSIDHIRSEKFMQLEVYYKALHAMSRAAASNFCTKYSRCRNHSVEDI